MGCTLTHTRAHTHHKRTSTPELAHIHPWWYQLRGMIHIHAYMDRASKSARRIQADTATSPLLIASRGANLVITHTTSLMYLSVRSYKTFCLTHLLLVVPRRMVGSIHPCSEHTKRHRTV